MSLHLGIEVSFMFFQNLYYIITHRKFHITYRNAYYFGINCSGTSYNWYIHFLISLTEPNVP